MVITCDVCTEKFLFKSMLDRHIISVHGGEKFECDECGKRFSRKYNLKKHISNVHAKRAVANVEDKKNTCTICNKSYQSRYLLAVHTRTVHGGLNPFECGECGKKFAWKYNLKRHMATHSGESRNPEEMPGSSNRRARGQPSDTQMIKRFSCTHCRTKFVAKKKLRPHLLYFCPVLRKRTRYTTERQQPHPPQEESPTASSPVTNPSDDVPILDPSFDEIETAFACRLRTFRLKEFLMSKTPLHVFLTVLLDHVSRLLTTVLNTYDSIKVNVVLDCEFNNINGETCEKNFKTMNIPVYQNSDVDELCSDMFEKLVSEHDACLLKGSGWAFVKPKKLEVRVNKHNPLRGEAHLILPKYMRGVVNTKNNDNFCFKYSLLAKFVDGDATNPLNFPLELENRYDWSGLEFPVKLKDVALFSKKNNISINVFGLDGKKKIFPLHVCDKPLPDHRDLLYVTSTEGRSHYAWIKHFTMLVKPQLTKNRRPIFICKRCFTYFNNAPNKLGLSGPERLAEHERFCIHHNPLRLDMPAQKSIKFKNVERSQRVRFTIYADFETILKNTGDDRKTHEHIPYSYCYLIKDSMNATPTVRTFRGEGAAKHFVRTIQEDALEIADTLYRERQLIPQLSVDQQAEFEMATECHICNEPFNDTDIKVRDHMHSAPYTFRGAAHRSCNLRHREQSQINVYFHNLRYDSHFIINELGFDKQRIDVIPNTEEQYITFTKYIPYENAPGKTVKLKFIDSFRFLPSSLAALADNLPKERFHHTRKLIPEDEKFNLITKKGIFPYNYVSSFEKLDETNLPRKVAFYNTLTLKHITDEEYAHAQKVWDTFNVNNLGEYSDIYLLTDVLLLTDVFENFRDTCMKTHDLDPAYYVTLPSYSWDCMLLRTNQTLDTLQDPEMHLFFEKGVRGGISQCVKRMAKANNKYCKDFNPNRPSTFIQYLDANSLYSWAMSQPLPTGGLRWLSQEEIDKLDIKSLSDTASEGYVFEVDVHYPRHLHNLHSQYPFLCEKAVPPGGKQEKLLTTLTDKKNYVVHYRTLKQAVQNGLQITKVHRVVRFDQSPWLKKYIDLNNELRKNAKDSFEKDLFKLFNNSVFGKFMENVRKRMNFRLETDEKRAEKLVSKSNFLYRTIFSENLAGFHLSKTNIVLEKPMYIGMCILDISKVLMYDFFYNILLKHYGEGNVKLLYTDTDSFILEFTTKDLFKSMLPIIGHYATSKYDSSNPAYTDINKGVLGKMKDETNGIFIREFLGIKSKIYCVILDGEDDRFIKRCKGINKPVVEMKLHAERYRACILNSEDWYTINTTFRSVRHKVFTTTENKLTLSAQDDKRVLCPDGVNTLAHGHYRIEYD